MESNFTVLSSYIFACFPSSNYCISQAMSIIKCCERTNFLFLSIFFTHMSNPEFVWMSSLKFLIASLFRRVRKIGKNYVSFVTYEEVPKNKENFLNRIFL